MVLFTSKTWNLLLLCIISLALYGTFQLFNGLRSHSHKEECSHSTCTFSDIAGTVPTEIQNLVSFINNPDALVRLGGHKPKGLLLIGPPGTGKTLLVRALAGETDSGFLYASGSDFIELYVGNGAKKIRELFSKAHDLLSTKASVIIFIDELDALGNRDTDCSEQRQTINQLLSCMDGFDQDEHIIVIGATNKPEVLDSALKRSGRFDHIIEVGLPDKQTRLDILQLHCKESAQAPTLNLDKIAKETKSFSGADLKLLVNEAITCAALEDCACISQEHFEAALKKIKQKKQQE